MTDSNQIRKPSKRDEARKSRYITHCLPGFTFDDEDMFSTRVQCIWLQLAERPSEVADLTTNDVASNLGDAVQTCLDIISEKGLAPNAPAVDRIFEAASIQLSITSSWTHTTKTVRHLQDFIKQVCRARIEHTDTAAWEEVAPFKSELTAKVDHLIVLLNLRRAENKEAPFSRRGASRCQVMAWLKDATDAATRAEADVYELMEMNKMIRQENDTLKKKLKRLAPIRGASATPARTNTAE
ncbi:hypothetical protein F4780DRAFT_764547 [Xylariomycetidae sp. FL0641]|nr:hypothetical protein F4780DRAFT_764547 [Xylariomycetidae sp. FL0641]